MQKVVPALRVRSYEASRAFYAKLGFEGKWKHQFEPRLPVFASIAGRHGTVSHGAQGRL